MSPRPRPTVGLSHGERKVFWRLLGACGDTHSRDVDIEEHCRQVAKTVVAFRAKAAA